MGRNEASNELIPSARRLVKSLRDMGYDFAAAVADLVDNSITARANLVAIDVEFDGDDSWVVPTWLSSDPFSSIPVGSASYEKSPMVTR